MLPNLRVIAASVVASVAIMVFGFGLFAIFRIANQSSVVLARPSEFPTPTVFAQGPEEIPPAAVTFATEPQVPAAEAAAPEVAPPTPETSARPSPETAPPPRPPPPALPHPISLPRLRRPRRHASGAGRNPRRRPPCPGPARPGPRRRQSRPPQRSLRRRRLHPSRRTRPSGPRCLRMSP